jgi:Aspartyl protease
MLGLLLLLGASPQAGTAPSPAAPRLAEADSLFRAHRYIELEQWLRRPGASGLPGAAFYAGMIDNRRDRNAPSLERLVPLLDDPAVRADSARRHALLETLADDYGKLYRYKDALRMLDLIEREFGPAMPDQERQGTEAAIELRRLLAGAPRQRTTIAAPFTQPLRRNAIGLLESPVRVGRDSSWWILDTGANFSTLTESMARRLGLALSRDSAATRGISGNLVSLRAALVPELSLGRATVRNMVVLVLPDSALYIPQIKYQISAILGYPLLEALRVVTLGPGRLAVGLAPAAGAEADLYLEQLNPVVAAAVEGHTDLYHLDTGANRSVLTSRFRLEHPALFAGLAIDTASLNGAGGGRGFPAYTLPELRVALGSHAVTLHRVTVFAGPTPAPFDQFYGNLGQDVIGGASLTLDFTRMKVVLSLPTPAQVVARYDSALGGEAAIRRHASSTTRGVREVPAGDSLIRLPFTFLARAPYLRLERVTLPAGKGVVLSGFDGRIGWSLDPRSGPGLLTGDELQSARRDADFYYPLDQLTWYTSMETVGVEDFEGQRCYRLHGINRWGQANDHFYSVATGLLAGYEFDTRWRGGPGLTRELFLDYRAVDGVLVPMKRTVKVRTGSGWSVVQTEVDTSVTFDDVDAAAFVPPAAVLERASAR